MSDCSTDIDMYFQAPSAAENGQPTITIDNDEVGAEDGNAVFEIPINKDFPVYGG